MELIGIGYILLIIGGMLCFAILMSGMISCAGREMCGKRWCIVGFIADYAPHFCIIIASCIVAGAVICFVSFTGIPVGTGLETMTNVSPDYVANLNWSVAY